MRFCSSYRLDVDILDKINDYFKHISDQSLSISENSTLSLLPTQLRAELILRKIWRSVKYETFIDTALFDRVSDLSIN